MNRGKHDAFDWFGRGGGNGAALPGTRPDLAEAFRDEETLLATVAILAPPADPPDGLLNAIEAGIDALPSRQIATLRADEGTWMRWSDKIWKKTLMKDPATGRIIYLLRCGPGAVMPAHTHVHDEHVFVIEGEFLMGDILVRAGDSHYSRAGSHHAEIRSATGCLLLVHA
jgi:quercetin dioxygenase-like cupin family protein